MSTPDRPCDASPLTAFPVQMEPEGERKRGGGESKLRIGPWGEREKEKKAFVPFLVRAMGSIFAQHRITIG